MSENQFKNTITFETIRRMSNNKKGALGEALTGIWLEEQIRNDTSIITKETIQETDPKIWFSHNGRSRCRYGRVDGNGFEKVSWEPDYSFYVTLPDHDIRKEILIEAKTDSAELERNQLEVMKLMSQEKDVCVFFTHTDFQAEQAVIEYVRIMPTGDNQVEDHIHNPDTIECYDCGREIHQDNAQIVDRSGSPVYICQDGDCE